MESNTTGSSILVRSISFLARLFSHLTSSFAGGSNETDIIDNDQLLLTVSEHRNGTALSSTHSILYGNVSAKM